MTEFLNKYTYSYRLLLNILSNLIAVRDHSTMNMRCRI